MAARCASKEKKRSNKPSDNNKKTQQRDITRLIKSKEDTDHKVVNGIGGNQGQQVWHDDQRARDKVVRDKDQRVFTTVNDTTVSEKQGETRQDEQGRKKKKKSSKRAESKEETPAVEAAISEKIPENSPEEDSEQVEEDTSAVNDAETDDTEHITSGDIVEDEKQESQETEPDEAKETADTKTEMSEEVLQRYLSKYDDEFDQAALLSAASHFDSKGFVNDIGEFVSKIQSDTFSHVTQDYPVEELRTLVSKVTNSMREFRNYTLYSQKQLEELRQKMTEVKHNVRDNLHTVGFQKYKDDAVDEDLVAQRAMEAKIAQLHADIAKTGIEIAEAVTFSSQTETAAVRASLAAEEAAKEAETIRLEMEERERLEDEAMRAAAQKRAAELKQKKEEEERKAQMEAEYARSLAEKNKKNHDGHSGSILPKAAWDNWPVHTYNTEAGDFDQGVVCMVRGDPNKFDEFRDAVQCDIIDQLEADFSYDENEELVSNIIAVTGTEQFKHPIYVAIPHCMSRASALSREPVVKSDEEGKWREIPSYDVHFENYKDLKFVQVKVVRPTKLAVVTQYKREKLSFGKRGGRLNSNVDQRITFSVEPRAFNGKENVEIQAQPVDSASVQDMKTRYKECVALLTSSAIVNLKWSCASFNDTTITMTLPCPPNPAKAKRAAAIKAMKEARMQHPQRSKPGQISPEPVETKLEDEKPKRQDSGRWYMGEYGSSDDDENDNLFLVSSTEKGKWTAHPEIHIQQIRLDLLQFDLQEPIQRFVILRTRTTSNDHDAVAMAKTIESYVSQRIAHFILKQRSEDPSDVVIHCVPRKDVEKTVEDLMDEGYDEGPAASDDIMLREGDVIEVAFRGNIKDEEKERLTFVYNSHVKTNVNIYAAEVDQYLQKSYPMFRGFAQLLKKVTTIHQPQKSKQQHQDDEDDEEAMKPRVEVSFIPLCELLIQVPKDHVEPIKPLAKAPITIKNTSDPVNEDLLRHIAADLGDEWKKLAHFLNVKRVRIQAILRNNENAERPEEEARFEMLMTWLKKVPKGLNKVSLLGSALLSVGRRDIAEDLWDAEHSFMLQKREQHRQTKH